MEYENTFQFKSGDKSKIRLNPCSNGIRKYLNDMKSIMGKYVVLILVLMEYENTPNSVGFSEYASLNPCSNGIRKYSLQINKLKNYCFKNITNILK